ncbi:MAG TPA: histidine--tRNA ligase [Bacteroidales bacterium]|nr:histidine--tRNA ligase [Bacteroidales bacterium]
MTPQKPSVPKGTRDFSPAEMARRDYIFDTIRQIFRSYGYQPIETPAMENLTTLLGKYGEEGDKLLFRILNSGNYLENITEDIGGTKDLSRLTQAITEKGLRYDLTVPFARYVVQHQHEIAFPFRRYQIQPVWRADRPQKGRYREFFQCDVDVIGSDSLLCEVELAQIADRVFSDLGIGAILRINNRKILEGVAESIGQKERMMDITVAMDKLEKAGLEPVMEELRLSGIPEDAVTKLEPLLRLEGKIKDKFLFLEELLQHSEAGRKGLAETRFVLEYLRKLELHNKFDFDITLARGLNYYTGTIFEVKALGASIGSICGGGRYDDLTGIFGLPGVSGVGISFGADRIFDLMNEQDLFPVQIGTSAQILFLNLGSAEESYSMQVAERFREAGIAAEIFPSAAKLKKQLEYAGRRGIPFAAIIGEEEMSTGMIMLRNMGTGEQREMREEEILFEVGMRKEEAGDNY